MIRPEAPLLEEIGRGLPAIAANSPGGRPPRAGKPTLKELRRLLEAYRLRCLRQAARRRAGTARPGYSATPLPRR